MSKKATRDWKPIEEQAVAAARQLGHELEAFAHPRRNASFRMADCKNCAGCGWVAYSPTRGFSAGGRIFKFKCGDPQAAGFLSAAPRQ